METKSALVRTDGAVELYSVALVYLNLAIVIYPGYTEGYDSLRLGKAL